TVPLPFVDHAPEQQPQPALTLDRLAEAFAHLGQPAPAAETPAPRPAEAATAEPAEAAQEAKAVAAVQEARPVVAVQETEPAAPDQSRLRRPRRHRGASRAQGAANETTVQHHEAEPASSAGHSHQAKAPETVKAQAAADTGKPAEEPIILGVGVPASEL
ncbi:MAG TPA: ribonuclease E/G, partial [Arthrobacter sp.]